MYFGRGIQSDHRSKTVCCCEIRRDHRSFLGIRAHVWMTPAILCSINHKNKLFVEKLRKPSAANIANYNRFRNCLNKTISNAKQLFYNKEFSRCQNNPKKTWETLNELLKQKGNNDTLPSKIVSDAGAELNDAKTISEEFNKYFTEVGKKLKQNIHQKNIDPLEYIKATTQKLMSFSQVSDHDVEQIILQLKDVGAGVDGINSKIFKCSYKPILSKLTYFFNLCLSTGTFPNPLKVAAVKPIFKSGDSSLVSNYRPISVLPFISKILEKNNILSATCILYKNQSPY